MLKNILNVSLLSIFKILIIFLYTNKNYDTSLDQNHTIEQRLN